MNLQVTITPAKTRVVEDTPEIIMVPMTRREAECVRGLLDETHASYNGPIRALRSRLDDAGVEPIVPLNADRIPAIRLTEESL